MADANADVICLDDRSNVLLCDLTEDSYEEALDALQEMFESMAWLDVVGTPMVDRLALRFCEAAESNGEAHKDIIRKIIRAIVQGGDDEHGVVLPVVRQFETHHIENVLSALDAEGVA